MPAAHKYVFSLTSSFLPCKAADSLTRQSRCRLNLGHSHLNLLQFCFVAASFLRAWSKRNSQKENQMIYESRMLWLLMALTGFFAALALLQGSQMIYFYHHSSQKDMLSVWLQEVEKCIETVLLGMCQKNRVSTNNCVNAIYFWESCHELERYGYQAEQNHNSLFQQSENEFSNKTNNNTQTKPQFLGSDFVLKQLLCQHDP